MRVICYSNPDSPLLDSVRYCLEKFSKQSEVVFVDTAEDLLKQLSSNPYFWECALLLLIDNVDQLQAFGDRLLNYPTLNSIVILDSEDRDLNKLAYQVEPNAVLGNTSIDMSILAGMLRHYSQSIAPTY